MRAARRSATTTSARSGRCTHHLGPSSAPPTLPASSASSTSSSPHPRSRSAGGRRGEAGFSPQPYFRFDRNDYSLDPRLVGRRVEVRAGQRAIIAVSLDSGEVIAKHRRVFAGGLTFTDREHQRALEELRGERKAPRREPEVQTRPLARYDELIPA